MYSIDTPTYSNYINYFCDSLHSLLDRYVNYYKNIKTYKNDILCDYKFYTNLLSFRSNDRSNNDPSEYLNFDYNLCYCINVPFKVSFNNYKNFYTNYNIINIPKIKQSGDMLLNGYSRTPILYLQLASKFVSFKFNNIPIKKYLIKLKYNLDLQITTYEDCLETYLNYNEILNDTCLFNDHVFKIKNGDFNSIDNFIHIINLENKKKIKIVNDFIRTNKFLKEILNIELFNMVYKILNLNKKFLPNNDSLINKLPGSIIDSLFSVFYRPTTIFNVAKNTKNLYYGRPFIKSLSTILFKERLLTNSFIHYTNQLNTISYLANKFKINIFGHNSDPSSRLHTDLNLRKIKNDYIGFIDILNTPDGETCGLLSCLSNNTVLDKFNLKLVSHYDSSLENFMYLDIPSKNLADVIVNNFSNVKKNSNFKIKHVEALKNNEFKIISPNTNDKNLNILNTLSINEVIIPFLFNDDPCRGLMGSKMHTQALPLLNSELPYVVTKYNSINNLLSLRCVYSLYNGVVKEVNNCRIIILDEKNRLIHHYLHPFSILDYNAFMSYKPVVWEGEKVSIGKVLAVPYDLKNSEFTLGFNNLVSYSFYKGYEHEDSVVINKNLLINDNLTSISFDIYEDYISLNEFNYIELTFPKFFKHNVFNTYLMDRTLLSTYKTYVFQDDILTSKVKYELSKSKSKKSFRIFRLAFLENKKLTSARVDLKIKKDSDGRLIKYDILSYNKYKQLRHVYSNKDMSYLMFRFFIFRVDRVGTGDKLCGRHGNKGVVSKMSDAVDLPYTFYGECPYSIVSPICSLARVNLGQFLEGDCGSFGLDNNCRLKVPVNLYDSYLYSNTHIKTLFNYFNNSYLNDALNNRTYLRDFKTGYKLKNFNLLSFSYFFKLMHTSKSKVQYRTVGKYSALTQQPVQGKNLEGSQKFGEMEVWALESYGSSYTIRELSSAKTNYKLFKKNNEKYGCSETFKVLTLELKSILINIDKHKNYKLANNYTKINY